MIPVSFVVVVFILTLGCGCSIEAAALCCEMKETWEEANHYYSTYQIPPAPQKNNYVNSETDQKDCIRQRLTNFFVRHQMVNVLALYTIRSPLQLFNSAIVLQKQS